MPFIEITEYPVLREDPDRNYPRRESIFAGNEFRKEK